MQTADKKSSDGALAWASSPRAPSPGGAAFARASVVVVVFLARAAVAGPAPTATAGDGPELMPLMAAKDGRLLTRPEVELGEPFQVILTVRARPDLAVALPASFPTGSFEILSRHETRKDDGGQARRQYELTVVAWELGEQTFPRVPISYVVDGRAVQAATTDGLAVVVVPTVPLGEEAPRDVAGPVPVLERDPRLLIAAGGALVVGVLAAVAALLARIARRRRTRAASAPTTYDRAPEQVALEELRRLATSPLLDAKDLRPLYFAAAQEIRSYLGRRFGFDALELTTGELLAVLSRHAGDEVPRSELTAWLSACDLVKYAAAPATRDQALQAIANAVTLVERARPTMLAPTPAQAGGNAR